MYMKEKIAIPDQGGYKGRTSHSGCPLEVEYTYKICNTHTQENLTPVLLKFFLEIVQIEH